ncbi:neural/ectodermal development factor IMP-L2-like isoform X2 [Leptidea sinapis]|uniref:neural/ectodermal development factor IMP-L2-like isoform X2 n=1 Tax=Leptidea sinapis TaxID=189913 RepID=UPI0021C3EFD5|nr:neural/ectodermal development factor IMP-L2-like isoform X2 [Leptidea sinapis]
MYLAFLVAAAAVVCGAASSNVNRHMKLLDVDNRIQSNSISRVPPRRSITFTKRPPAKLVHRPGSTVELTCEAIAAPAPSVHWFRNDVPVYEYDKESNEILDSNPTSLARVSSTLLLSRAEETAKYTCLVVSGSKTARRSSVVFNIDGGTDLSERSKLAPLSPRVLVWYKVFVDVMGSNVALPCRVRGHPRPHIIWRDHYGNDVKSDPRMKVLRSGELVISNLSWSDMGEFSCTATNMFGSAEITTFLYPAKPSDTSD